MNRSIILCFSSCSLFLFFKSCFSQGFIYPEWVKIVHSTTGNAEAWGIDVDENGDLFWPVSMDSVPGMGYDIYCWKLGQDGIPIWTQPKAIAGLGTHQSYVVRVSDSSLYVGGRYCVWFTGSCEMMLTKLDKTTGYIDCFKVYDFMGEYDEDDAIEIGNDGLYLSGWATKASNPWDSDGALLKLTSDGDVIYKNSWGLDSTGEHFDGNAVLDDQFIYTVGLWKGTSFANLYEGRSILAKFNRSDGSLVDSVTFGNQDWWLNWENALGMATDGNRLYITGVSTTSLLNNQVYVASFDTNLNLQWIQYWGGSLTESARAIGVFDGDIYVAGSTNSPEYTSGDYDVFLLKYDTLGNYVSYQTWGGQRDDNAHDLCFYNSNIFISGTTKNNPSDVLDSSLKAFLIKADLDALSLDRTNMSFSCLKVYPNPVNDFCTISGNYDKDINEAEIRMYDLTGRIILIYNHIQINKGVLEVSLDLSSLQSGIYIGQVVSASRASSFKIQVFR